MGKMTCPNWCENDPFFLSLKKYKNHSNSTHRIVIFSLVGILESRRNAGFFDVNF